MTTIPATRTRFELVPLDLYRDIHKGIRAELFAVTGTAGSLDPADVGARAAVADHIRATVEVLVSHAEHEDVAIHPTLEQVQPALAERVEADHVALEVRMLDLQALADEAVAAPEADGRRATHQLYLELASFTAAYLAHQDEEEQVVMPALFEAVGFEAVLAMHQAIVSSIPPDQMAQSLAFMLPAMQVDDRTELLGGMQAGAPPEAFAQVWSLVRSVLPAADVAVLAQRLGVD
jgi:hypothetical protein